MHRRIVERICVHRNPKSQSVNNATAKYNTKHDIKNILSKKKYTIIHADIKIIKCMYFYFHCKFTPTSGMHASYQNIARFLRMTLHPLFRQQIYPAEPSRWETGRDRTSNQPKCLDNIGIGQYPCSGLPLIFELHAKSPSSNKSTSPKNGKPKE